MVFNEIEKPVSTNIKKQLATKVISCLHKGNGGTCIN